MLSYCCLNHNRQVMDIRDERKKRMENDGDKMVEDHLSAEQDLGRNNNLECKEYNEYNEYKETTSEYLSRFKKMIK